MRFSIGHKVFLTVFLIITTVVGLVLGLTHISIGRGFTDYIRQIDSARMDDLVRSLESYYAEEGTWQDVPVRDFGVWLGKRVDWPIPPPMPSPAPYGGQPPFRRMLDRICLLSPERHLIAGLAEAASSHESRPVYFRGAVVGYLSLEPFSREGFTRQDRAFLHAQILNLIGLGLAGLALSTLAAIVLARHLRRAIGALVQGTRQLALGRFSTRLAVDRGDELGQLAQDFNLLAQALESHERSRRQWVADTSHELRTPLAVLRAQVEAVQDGVHAPDAKTLEILHSEILGLEKLVDDLHRLARLDEGMPAAHMSELDPVEALRLTVDAFQDRFAKDGLKLQMEGGEEPALMPGDSDQLRRLFANLMENTLRYTDAGGRLQITCMRQGQRLSISFQDTEPGVPEASLERLFDRFYRVDASRCRDQGGSGLGLSICRSIVEGHGGTIQAAPSVLGGLRIDIEFPIRAR